MRSMQWSTTASKKYCAVVGRCVHRTYRTFDFVVLPQKYVRAHTHIHYDLYSYAGGGSTNKIKRQQASQNIGQGVQCIHDSPCFHRCCWAPASWDPPNPPSLVLLRLVACYNKLVCIDQLNIIDGLRMLPVSLMSCKHLLVLFGQT